MQFKIVIPCSTILENHGIPCNMSEWKPHFSCNPCLIIFSYIIPVMAIATTKICEPDVCIVLSFDHNVFEEWKDPFTPLAPCGLALYRLIYIPAPPTRIQKKFEIVSQNSLSFWENIPLCEYLCDLSKSREIKLQLLKNVMLLILKILLGGKFWPFIAN